MDNELSSPLSGEDYHGERWVDEREGKRAKQFDALSLLLLLSLSLSLDEQAGTREIITSSTRL